MPYDGKILSRAMARFDEDKQRRARQFRERQQQLFAREPELADIDRRLRGTMSQIITRALKGGRDPVPAIHAIRDENLALQRRRGEILTALGCPADYLEEKPRCARCGDAGFLPDGSMCACLRSYYAREQIAELSHMLDIGSQSFDTFRLDYYSTDRGGLPRSPREAAQRNLEICQSFARDFRPGKQNLLLFGAPGLARRFCPPASPGWSARTASPWCTTRRGIFSPSSRRPSSAGTTWTSRTKAWSDAWPATC